jgi:hypothetical protein
LLTNTTHWYSVIVTYDGSINTSDGLDRVQIYVDGVMETLTMSCRTQAGSFPFNIAAGPADFGIGNYLSSAGTPCLPSTKYNGQIDDIRIYSRVLNSAEIGQLVNETNVGITSYENPGMLEIYPNPAQDRLSIDLSGFTKANNALRLTISNARGEIVYELPLKAGDNILDLDISSYAKGTYFLSVLDVHQLTTRRKLVIQ